MGDNFISFSADEIRGFDKLEGTHIKCRKCGETHEIKLPKCKLENGREVESDTLQYTVCADNTMLLVGVRGKKVY